MGIRFDVGVPVSAPVAEQVAYIQRAEALGFGGVALGEAGTSGHDIFVTMALAARVTERVTLYPAVVNPVSRHPLVLANLARSLMELAPGRIELGLGLGSSGLVRTGLRPASLSAMREAVTFIRSHLLELGVTPPPVLLGASGPRMLALAGEVADAVLLEVGADPKGRADAVALVEKAAAAAGRPPGVPLVDYLLVSIADNREDAVARAVPWLDYFLRFGTFRLALDAHGIGLAHDTGGGLPSDSSPLPAPAPDLYESGSTSGRRPAFPGPAPVRSAQTPPSSSLAPLSRAQLVELADLLAVVGTPSEVVERFEALEQTGVRRVCCMLPGGPRSHARALDLLARHVLPHFTH